MHIYCCGISHACLKTTTLTAEAVRGDCVLIRDSILLSKKIKIKIVVVQKHEYKFPNSDNPIPMLVKVSYCNVE